MTHRDRYRSLATDYHWFFDDVGLRLGSDVPGVRAAIAALVPGARVLDAACGIGVDVLALHRRGFDVVAADASPAMVELARQRLVDAAVSLPVHECRWDRLLHRLPAGSFDAVFCIGGSIGHAEDATAMVAALRAFHTLVRPGGLLVLDSHDWEVVLERGSRTDTDARPVARGGERYVRAYRWHLDERIDGSHVYEVSLLPAEDERAGRRSYRIEMVGFTRRVLRDRLREAGFGSVALDRIPGDDRYTAIARKP